MYEILLVIVLSAPLIIFWRTYFSKTNVKITAVSDDIDIDINIDDDAIKRDYFSSVAFVAMDCEMVGIGRHGKTSALARCSLVTLLENDQLKVLYDAHVKPTKKITDYRTQWSGITKDRLLKDDVITLEKCRMDVLQMLSSQDGKVVVLVGHALKNDFDVLGIRHPVHLIRDTAAYRPFMRAVRKRFYPRKLSELSKEELRIEIQNSYVASPLKINTSNDRQKYSIGHDSVEDAAATLMLYNKVSSQWEKSLRFPLQQFSQLLNRNSEQNGKINKPSITLYLDGCNIPIGLRNRNGISSSIQLVSKSKSVGNTHVQTPMDWVPVFKSWLSIGLSSRSKSQTKTSMPPICKICVLFDGKMFSGIPTKDDPQHKTIQLAEYLTIEITEDTVEVDDILVDKCIEDRNRDNVSKPVQQNFVDVEDVIGELNANLSDNAFDCKKINTSYVVVRRKGGGSKTNKKLFDKLRLRRAEEGAYCLVPSLVDTNLRLQKHSLNIGKQLQRAKVHRIVEYEKRLCKDVRSVVVTDDILLSDRVVTEGGVVLSFSQLQQLL
mmetsp:Transcript_6624/g.7454  ORF Transcript_6624/g.7454 Transcript_6624/m.7454 type:complete len:549 (-) Transcript_6624:1220-2866(-)